MTTLTREIRVHLLRIQMNFLSKDRDLLIKETTDKIVDSINQI